MSNNATKVILRRIRKQHDKLASDSRWLLHKYNIRPFNSNIRNKFKTPMYLLVAFLEYFDNETHKGKTPTIVGFAAHMNISTAKLKRGKAGDFDLPSVSDSELETKSIRELQDIERMTQMGQISLKGRNYSDVIDIIFTRCENALVEKSFKGGAGARAVEFLLKNHFNYADKTEQTTTSHATITLVNDLPAFETTITSDETQPKPDKIPTIDAQDIDLTYLLGDNDV